MKCYLPQNPLLQKMGSTHPLRDAVEALFYHRFTVLGARWKHFPFITLTTNEPVEGTYRGSVITFTSLPRIDDNDERQFHRLSDLVDRFNHKFKKDLEVHRGKIYGQRPTPSPEHLAWYLTLCDRGGPWVAKIPREYNNPTKRKRFQERGRKELVAFGKWLMDNLPTK